MNLIKAPGRVWSQRHIEELIGKGSGGDGSLNIKSLSMYSSILTVTVKTESGQTKVRIAYSNNNVKMLRRAGFLFSSSNGYDNAKYYMPVGSTWEGTDQNGAKFTASVVDGTQASVSLSSVPDPAFGNPMFMGVSRNSAPWTEPVNWFKTVGAANAFRNNGAGTVAVQSMLRTS